MSLAEPLFGLTRRRRIDAQGTAVTRTLHHADFSQSFIDADFNGANLQGARFASANVKTCSFDGANLRGTDFSKSAIDAATFDRADVSDANFEGASAHGYVYQKGESPGRERLPTGR